MAEVLEVIAASILVASILRLLGSISTNTGAQPSHTILLVVAAKEKGVVIISPFKSNAFIAICKAIVPLVTNNRFLTFKCSANRTSSSLASGPILVSQPFSQMVSKYAWYSS